MDAVAGPNATVLFGILVTVVTAAFKYFISLTKEQNEMLRKSNETIIELSKAHAEVASLVPVLLREHFKNHPE